MSLTNYLTQIADAIRTKKGTSDKINAQNFASEILNLPSGGGDGDTDAYIVKHATELPSDATNKSLGLVTEDIKTTWEVKNFSGLSIGQYSYNGRSIWTDGTNIYYSSSSTQYVLNKETDTWETKVWNGLTSFDGRYIWIDGTNIYYSNSTEQYVLNKETDTWESKTWTGLTSLSGQNIWTDGTNIYYSNSSTQYVLDVATSTWSKMTWKNLTNFYGEYIWTDGTNIYYSNSSTQYVLDVATSTWSKMTWIGLTGFYGNNIWTDGNIYHSNGEKHYILNKETSTWETMIWDGELHTFYGQNIWTDGTNIYYLYQYETPYVLTYTPEVYLRKEDEWLKIANSSGNIELVIDCMNKHIEVVDSLPSTGEEDVVYSCGDSFYKYVNDEWVQYSVGGSSSGGNSNDIIYDEVKQQVTINGVLYDLSIHVDGIETNNGNVLPVLPDMNKYWAIFENGSGTITAYVADRGIGWYNDKVYPFDSGNTLLNTDYSGSFKRYNLTDGEWVASSNTYSTSTVGLYFRASNTDIYEWSNSLDITQTIKYNKNN